MHEHPAATSFGYRVAQVMQPITVTGAYDPDAQLWVGDGGVSANGTTSFSGTACHTATASNTNCGFDYDTDYDNCGDEDRDCD